MKKLSRHLFNMRLRKKMILSHFVIALIPLLIFSAVLGSKMLRDAKQTSTSHTEQMVNQMSESIDVYIGTVDKLVDYVIHSVGDLHTAEGTQPGMQELLENLMDAYPEIAGILIAYSDESYMTAGMTRISRDPFMEEPWVKTAQARGGQLGIISSAVGRNVVTNTTYSADKVFSVVKSFDLGAAGDGVVLVDIRHDIIEKLIDSLSVSASSFLYVADSEGSVVYTPANPLVYRIDNLCFDESDTTVQVDIRGQNYWISNHFSPYTGWRSIGVVSGQEYFENTRQIFIMLFLCVLLSCLLVVILAIRVADSVTGPLLSLRRLMKNVEKGDFSVRFQTECDDEIGELGNSFNRMLERLEALIQQLYIEKQARLEAQLKTLHEQIKPHFLYNTLDTISWMARSHEAYDVVKLVDALTSMFRIGLSQGRDFITIRDEKKHVQNYLYIQKTRYQSKLRYQIEIPEELDNVMVPKLILQPLVENAIYHGLKLKPGGGTITISGHEEAGKVILTVHDDGAGVPADRLVLLQEQLRQPGNVDTKVGFGLFYIAERINLCYGPDYPVTIESTEELGTTVTLRVPKEDEKRRTHV